MKSPSTLPAVARRALDEFTEQTLAAFGRRLRQVILFGSAARGTAGPGSDIDVLVIVDAPPMDAARVLEDLTYPWLREGLLISALPVTPGDWAEMQRRGKRLAKNVQREGIVLAAGP